MRLSLLLSLLFSPFVVLAAPSPSRTRGLTIVESPSPSHTISTNPFDIYMPTPFDEHDELMPSDELEELGDEDKENTSGLLVIRPTAGPAHPIPSRSRRDSMEEYVDSTPLQEYASSSLFSPFSSHDPQQTRIEDLSMDQLTQVLEKAILVRHQLFLSINTHRKEWKKVKNLNEVTRYLYQKRQVQYSHELEWRHANIEQVIDALEERRIELMLVNARADRGKTDESC